MMTSDKEYRKKRIVEGMIVSGEIECTDEAIKKAMPSAVRDAKEVYDAAVEFISG